jgi:hypothetical protein
MGAGDKFRIEYIGHSYISLGIFIGRNCEHEWSISIDLIKIKIYIGIGKGYHEL